MARQHVQKAGDTENRNKCTADPEMRVTEKKKKQTMTIMFKELEAIENSTKNLQIIKKESIAEKRLKF